MKKIAVFASGTGTNCEAIAENIEKGVLDASIELLVVDQKRAKVIEKGKRHGVETLVISCLKHMKTGSSTSIPPCFPTSGVSMP